MNTFEETEPTTADFKKLTDRFTPPCLLPAQECRLWGKAIQVQPALCATRFGKGDLLIGISPTAHRPRYYLVWVDEEIFANMENHLNDIWLSLEENFDYRESTDTSPYQWPMVDTTTDCHWWKAGLGDVLSADARAEIDKQNAGQPAAA